MSKLLVAGLAVLASAVNGAPVQMAGKVKTEVSTQLAAEGSADIFVHMSHDLDARTLVAGKRFANRAARITYVHQALQAHAMANHAPVVAMLGDFAGDFKTYRSFWITNSVFIEDASPSLIEALAQRYDVDAIYPNAELPLVPPMESEDIPRVNGVEWGVDAIKAPAVWAAGNTGQGITVAGIDTGVLYTHEALVGSYRGNLGNGKFDHDYNFYDSRGQAAPYDTNGHGTHTMGTIAGTNGVGVAPGAKWIAAIGCRAVSCSTMDLTSSAEWMTCPTRSNGQDADCSKAPHVINNSWGGGSNDPWYKQYVQAWHAAGIVPVFALGNSGPSCSTANSPGDYEEVIGVGASNNRNAISSFSSRGPTRDGRLKPDITAPGENIRSAYHTGDTAYYTMSGTSMATPHTTGAVALILAQSNAVYDDVMSFLITSTTTSGLVPDKDCGDVDADTLPNNSWGYGLLNVCSAVAVHGGSAACSM